MPKRSKSSEVWKHISDIPEKKIRRCNHCDSKFGESSSTATLWSHLKLKHGISKKANSNVQEDNDITIVEENSNSLGEPAPKTSDGSVLSGTKKNLVQSKIPKMMKKQKSLVERVAKMASVSGFTFRQIAKDDTIQDCLEMCYQKRVKSPSTVGKYVKTFATEKRAEVKQKVEKILESGGRFSCDCDEFTAPQNTRFMTVNTYSNGELFNLGMIHIPKSMKSKDGKEFLEKRLLEFGIDPQTNLVNDTTDAAAVMVKMGRIMDCEHQTCIVHGFHLGICDCFYPKKKKKNKVKLKKIFRQTYFWQMNAFL